MFISVFMSKLPKQTQTKKQANACLLFWDLTEVRINRRLARASPSLMTCSSESHCTTFESVNSHERNKIADKATQLSGFSCIYATWEFTHKGADVQQNQSYEVRLCLRFYFRGDRRIAAQLFTTDEKLRRNPQQSTPLHSAAHKKNAQNLCALLFKQYNLLYQFKRITLAIYKLIQSCSTALIWFIALTVRDIEVVISQCVDTS